MASDQKVSNFNKDFNKTLKKKNREMFYDFKVAELRTRGKALFTYATT